MQKYSCSISGYIKNISINDTGCIKLYTRRQHYILDCDAKKLFCDSQSTDIQNTIGTLIGPTSLTHFENFDVSYNINRENETIQIINNENIIFMMNCKNNCTFKDLCIYPNVDAISFIKLGDVLKKGYVIFVKPHRPCKNPYSRI